MCRGRAVSLAWPVDDEFDRITALRNRDRVRHRFLDNRSLDVEANREWLSHGMRRPHEALFSIRLLDDRTFVGAIGWSDWNRATASLELGRVMVDVDAARGHRSWPVGYPGIAADAGTALRDYAFAALGLASMHSLVIADNRLALRAVCLGGARVVARDRAERAGGETVDVVRLALTRAEWEALVSEPEPA